MSYLACFSSTIGMQVRRLCHIEGRLACHGPANEEIKLID
jgi:hypothetical protein